MKRYVFEIRFNGYIIIYDPIMNQIIIPSINRKMNLPKRQNSYFPVKRELDKYVAKKYYKPLVFTIFQGLHCNLNCIYCFTPHKDNSIEISEDLVRKGADFVAKNCKERNYPFNIGFRGGNEPLLKIEQVKRNLEICRDVAKRNKVSISVHAVTNGIIPESTAEWVSENFDSILLSWDGPKSIQDINRPLLNGNGTSEKIEKTAKIFQKQNSKIKILEVRPTITNDNVSRIPEIVEYFHSQGIKYVAVYRAYQNHISTIDSNLLPNQDLFFKSFIKAQEFGIRHGMTVFYPGTRLNEIHDKNCYIFQNNLAVTPDGFFSSCFEATHNLVNENNKFIYGEFNKELNELSFDWIKLLDIYKKLGSDYSQCETCFNILHCNKLCPDICILRDKPAERFDCSIEYNMGLLNILRQIGYKFTEEEIENPLEFFKKIQINRMIIQSK